MDLEEVTAAILSQWSHALTEEELESCTSSSASSSPETPLLPPGDQGVSPRAPAARSVAPVRLGKVKMSTKRRVKASEREKLRMRSLAEALHQLRDYLPQDSSRRGQPLTKIQTLQSTIRYINTLSDLLARS